MEQKQEAVKADGQHAAADQGVKAKEIIAPESQEVDYMKLVETITEQEKELAKAKADTENYKKGLLKAKGKIPNDQEIDPKEEGIAELVQEEVQKALLGTKEAKLQADKDAALKTMAKKISELSIAVKNRASGVNPAAGSNQEGDPVKDNFFTDSQLAALKARGLDPEKVKANMIKQATQPRA